MYPTAASAVNVFRPQLLQRRARLQEASGAISAEALNELISEIDAALSRIDNGSFGLCETCHDPIETERLEGNPLVRFCLDHLSEAELRAHEQDLALATQIQLRLLPPRDIALQGWEAHYRYEPAGVVGGDYCELVASGSDTPIFFAVGDVAGKGVAASLLMTHLSAIFRSLLPLELSLRELVCRANRLFSEGTPATHYATLVCGLASGNRVELCNAGHCTPLLLQRAGIERFDPTGLPLGLFAGAEYEVSSASLDEGESLILYSDGITEARNPAGQEYGDDRLASFLRVHFDEEAGSLADGLLRDVGEFSCALPRSDDMTLLLVRRSP